MKGIKNPFLKNKYIYALRKRGFAESLQEMNKIIRKDQNKILLDIAEQLRKGNLEDEMDSIMFEKYKSIFSYLIFRFD